MRISDWSSDVCSSDLFWIHGPKAVSGPTRARSARGMSNEIHHCIFQIGRIPRGNHVCHEDLRGRGVALIPVHRLRRSDHHWACPVQDQAVESSNIHTYTHRKGEARSDHAKADSQPSRASGELSSDETRFHRSSSRFSPALVDRAVWLTVLYGKGGLRRQKAALPSGAQPGG